MRGLSLLIQIVLTIMLAYISIIFINKTSVLKNEAIKHNCAMYHPQTGEFQWK